MNTIPVTQPNIAVERCESCGQRLSERCGCNK